MYVYISLVWWQLAIASFLVPPIVFMIRGSKAGDLAFLSIPIFWSLTIGIIIGHFL